MSEDATNCPSPEPQDNTMPTESDQQAQRYEKRREIEEQGIPAYGDAPQETLTPAQTVVEAFELPEGQELTETVYSLAGRITAKRTMGKSAFADIRDESGRIQVYAKRDVLGQENFDFFKSLDIGDIIVVTGPSFRTRAGEITVRIQQCRLLTKSLRPLPEKWHGLSNVEQRHRQRYLDMIGNPEVKDIFRRRVELIRNIRRYLEDLGFLEVETPMLQPIPGGAAANPFETYYAALDAHMYLRIAPELYLKRLLVGGFEKVFELNRNFRNEGLSRHHNPEFTMVEVYQAYGDCRTMMALVEDMVTTTAQYTLETLKITCYDNETELDLNTPWRRIRFHDLVCERMGADWFELDNNQRIRRAAEQGVEMSTEMNETEITQEVYEKLIEPTLIQPTFVTELPVDLVPLARRTAEKADTVDVFELVINGQELAPGYSELNDPVEQRRRLLNQLGVNDVSEIPAGKLDEDFLTALEYGMPPAGGMGIGIDRLVMTLLGQDSIREVILFPHLRPQEV